MNLNVDTRAGNYVTTAFLNNRTSLRNFLNNTDYYTKEGANRNITTHQIKAFFMRRAIEEKIRIAKKALKDAINLIHDQQHPILQNLNKLIIPDAPLIKNKQNYYIPKNQELYNYLDNHYHRFTSKNKDFLIINQPCDLVQVVIEFNKYFTKNNNLTNIVERNDQGTPIIAYYYNFIGSLDEIYEHFHEVHKKEI